MGANASSIGASVFGVVGDHKMPDDADLPVNVRGTTISRSSIVAPVAADFENPTSAELRAVKEAWSKLPETARAKFLGIVEGATSH